MENKVILIQGAMDIEIEYLLSQLVNVEKKHLLDYEFYIGSLKDYKIVVSKTLIGTINATIATMIGINNFKPNLVINQGIAGAQRENIHTGDIIIGEKCYNINSFDMPPKEEGKGSNPFEWEPNKRAKDAKIANEDIVKKLEKYCKSNYEKSVYVGNLGSGDVFSREIDRINWISNKFDTVSEDMESIGVYSVCNKYNVPCVGIRIISNNEMIGEKLDKKQATVLQNILVNFLKQ